MFDVANTDELAEKMLKLLDHNGNGKVEKHELNSGFTAAFETTCGLHAMVLTGIVEMLGAVSKVLAEGTHPTGADLHVHVFFGASRPARYRDVERLPILQIINDAAGAATAGQPATEVTSGSCALDPRSFVSPSHFAMADMCLCVVCRS